jgi:MFS family permease
MKPQEIAEFRAHWKLVMAASLGFAFSSIVAVSAGIFMEPLGKEFHWGRTITASGTSITAILTFLMSPIFGMLVDRWGTRSMALWGIVLAGVMIACFGLTTGAVWLWIVMWAIYAFAAVMIKSTVWSAAVSSVFTSGRGLALGLTLSGTALAQIIIPPISNMLIDAYGWRGAFFCLGLGGGALAFAVCYLFFFDGYAMAKRQRDMAKTPVAKVEKPLLDVPGLTLAQAMRNRDLQMIAASTFIMMVITIALNVHQFEILRATGISRTNAAYLSSIAGVAGIAGKLITGWLLDRYHARMIGGVTLGVSAMAFLILLMPHVTVTWIIIAMFINGYSGGTKLQIASFLTSAYGGMRHFGAIFGVIASLIAAGSGLGPVLAGMVFDKTGSYDLFLICGTIGSLVSGVIVLALRDYPDWLQVKTAAA